MLDLAGETCLIYHKTVSFYHVDEAKEHLLEDFSLEEGLSSVSTLTIGTDRTTKFESALGR